VITVWVSRQACASHVGTSHHPRSYSDTPRTLAWIGGQIELAGLGLDLRKLPCDGSPSGALDAGTHHVCGRFRAMDVIGETFYRLLRHDALFELLCGKCCGLK
jgi:hypothetical protein